MKTKTMAASLTLVLLSGGVSAGEPAGVAERHRAILADYQRILTRTTDREARAAANRLALAAYRGVIHEAAAVKELGAEDLYAVGLCHEAVGETDKAQAAFLQALARRATADTHLALARVLLEKDLAAAEKHHAEAGRLQPGHFELAGFHQRVATVMQQQGRWADAVRHLERLLPQAKARANRQPGSSLAQTSYEDVGRQLDRMRRYSAMMGKAAPALAVEAWAQGDPMDLTRSTGKVVLLDFFALWSSLSRERMETVKKLHAKYGSQGLEVLGVGLAYQVRYDEADDRVRFDKGISAADERQAVAAYAKKHGIGYRLGVVPAAVTEEYGVVGLPHTVLIDRSGMVRRIHLSGHDDQQLGATILDLLKR